MKRILTPRRTLLSLTILAVGTTAAVIASNALAIPAPPPATPTTIVCTGQICLGTGATQYEWIVTPGNQSGGVTQVDIGTESPAVPASFVNAPGGWGYTVVAVPPGSFRDHFPVTAHGTATASNGSCEYVIRWQGPNQTGTFTLGIDNFIPPHDAKWVTSGGFSSTFANPVGMGLGPVHSPIFFDDDEGEED